jgi:hypothetical protein
MRCLWVLLGVLIELVEKRKALFHWISTSVLGYIADFHFSE